ncbi:MULTISPECIES: TetR family transcriptional regulator [Streptomyces]|uniref:TetR family transcriptional regulator n=1 Tax=Streptomyces caviscabies TaxID=90079 RepID=A0ABW2MF54_9ACTN|nr:MULTISPECIES: TetR family transcriptional regulator [unclassified Streptomyces]
MATQLDIARGAAELFSEKGPDGTTAEEIAARAGVAPRTFYRYFRSKQDAIGPLLSSGADRWRSLLADTGPDVDLARALESAAVASFEPSGAPGEEEGLRWTRDLLQAAQADPALRAVWYRVNQESEELLLPVLSRLAGPDADLLKVRLVAAAATAAIRVALEMWATTDPDSGEVGSPVDLVVKCLRELTGALTLLSP